MFRQRTLNTVVLLALAVVFAATSLPVQAADELCFPETNQCISGRFRQYWEQNGGLAVFGFPLAPAREERNRDTGQFHLTQWFERNRFELHPENPAPYDVLLGRLGDDRLVQQGRYWQAEGRESGAVTGCRWFAETGHNVCDQGQGLGFKTYWESHGLAQAASGPRLDAYQRSLALFGLPLTAARTETNSSNDTVVTQWFERARFEWHPDKPAEFKVLLGRLGDELLPTLGGGERPTGRIVYVSARDTSTGGDLYSMNADGTGQIRLTSTGAIPLETAEYAVSPAGDHIAYRAGGSLHVIHSNGSGHQVVARTEVGETAPFEVFAPTWAPDGSYLAYVLNGDIYASRLDGSPPARITQDAGIASPACLSWARNGYLTFRTPAMHTVKLFVVRSDGTDLRQVAFGLCGTLSPAGERMIFTNGAALWLVNLDGSNAHPLTGSGNFLPASWSPDGTRVLSVAYESANPDAREIFVVDPTARATWQLTSGAIAGIRPAWSPDGKHIAFASRRTGRSGIYVMRADGTEQTLLPALDESGSPQWLPR